MYEMRRATGKISAEVFKYFLTKNVRSRWSAMPTLFLQKFRLVAGNVYHTEHVNWLYDYRYIRTTESLTVGKAEKKVRYTCRDLFVL